MLVQEKMLDVLPHPGCLAGQVARFQQRQQPLAGLGRVEPPQPALEGALRKPQPQMLAGRIFQAVGLVQYQGIEIRQKALAVAKANPQATVIGADTIVVLEGIILGKPRDRADAIKMLQNLSGKVHSVFTGVCLIKDSKENSFFEETKVEFYSLSNEEIEAYVDTGEPMDKAGAYGIQGRGCLLVKRIEGDYFNVVGLPVGRLIRELKA